jgi:hypothetical protein
LRHYGAPGYTQHTCMHAHAIQWETLIAFVCLTSMKMSVRAFVTDLRTFQVTYFIYLFLTIRKLIAVRSHSTEILLLFEQGEWISVTGFTASNDNLLHFIKLICKIKINHLATGLGLQVKESKKKRRIKNSDSLYRTITPRYTSKQIRKCRLCNSYRTFTFFCLTVSHDIMCFIVVCSFCMKHFLFWCMFNKLHLKCVQKHKQDCT